MHNYSNIALIYSLYLTFDLMTTWMIVLASYPGAQIMIDGLVRYQSISSNVGGRPIANNSALHVQAAYN